ncbi:MAG: copper chaperone PCu(A)C [Phaeospirillum sp.]|nr:copper chaperone PCu(A)C [Phaeospirillum sp.]
MKMVLAAAAALLLLGAQANAADIEVAAPFMRAAPVVGGNGAAFLTISNHGSDDRLTGAQADISKAVELHTHVKDGDIYRMRKVDALAVPMHGTVALKPGGDHIMFIGLTAPVKEGAMVPLTLVFEKAGKIVVNVPVQAAGAMAPGAMMPAGAMPGGPMNHSGH